MPLYEFTCNDCNNDFEKLVRTFAQPQEVECPTCGSRKTKKKMSVFATKAKGDSFSFSSSSSSSCAPGGT